MSDAGGTTAYDIRKVLKALPHRYPLLLVDRVKSIELGERIHAVKAVTFNEEFFQGHFPGAPIMPGVTIIEALAQTSAVLVGLTLDLVDKEPLVYFMSIDKAKFRRKVVPGDVLDLHVKVLRGSSKIWKFEGRASVNGEMAAEAEFMAMIDLTKRG